MKQLVYIYISLYLLASSCLYVCAIDWSGVDKILEDGIKDHTYPGCVAAVGDAKGLMYMKAFGNFTYGIPPPATPDHNPAVDVTQTLYDMASLTKVFVTTTATMQFYQRGELDLDMKVSDPSLLGSAFANNGKDQIHIRHLLAHSAGFPPDPIPNYWEKSFGCPETSKPQPAEKFTCQQKIYQSLMTQTLHYPTGTKQIYSDLSMITMMYVIGRRALDTGRITVCDLRPECTNIWGPGAPELYQCYYEAYARKYVFEPLNLGSSLFLPSEYRWKNIAPTWNDTNGYQKHVIQGTVSDGNSYALGGIAGHAGLFSNLPDTTTLAHQLLFASPQDSYVNRTTIDLFIKPVNLTQGPRALGWLVNDPKADTYMGCGELSPRTFYHTGYTGTEICCDPDRKIFTVLLTNRCYPNAESTIPAVKIVRQKFNTAVKNLLDNAAPYERDYAKTFN
jgi:CubicO group peptidase (beta-lactamase class C family)